MDELSKGGIIGGGTGGGGSGELLSVEAASAGGFWTDSKGVSLFCGSPVEGFMPPETF